MEFQAQEDKKWNRPSSLANTSAIFADNLDYLGWNAKETTSGHRATEEAFIQTEISEWFSQPVYRLRSDME